MNKDHFYTLLTDPTKASEADRKELEEITRKFPYFATAYIMKAGIARDRDSIGRAAVHTLNRTVLRKYVQGSLDLGDSAGLNGEAPEDNLFKTLKETARSATVVETVEKKPTSATLSSSVDRKKEKEKEERRQSASKPAEPVKPKPDEAVGGTLTKRGSAIIIEESDGAELTTQKPGAIEDSEDKKITVLRDPYEELEASSEPIDKSAKPKKEVEEKPRREEKKVQEIEQKVEKPKQQQSTESVTPVEPAPVGQSPADKSSGGEKSPELIKEQAVEAPIAQISTEQSEIAIAEVSDSDMAEIMESLRQMKEARKKALEDMPFLSDEEPSGLSAEPTQATSIESSHLTEEVETENTGDYPVERNEEKEEEKEQTLFQSIPGLSELAHRILGDKDKKEEPDTKEERENPEPKEEQQEKPTLKSKIDDIFAVYSKASKREKKDSSTPTGTTSEKEGPKQATQLKPRSSGSSHTFGFESKRKAKDPKEVEEARANDPILNAKRPVSPAAELSETPKNEGVKQQAPIKTEEKTLTVDKQEDKPADTVPTQEKENKEAVAKPRVEKKAKVQEGIAEDDSIHRLFQNQGKSNKAATKANKPAASPEARKQGQRFLVDRFIANKPHQNRIIEEEKMVEPRTQENLAEKQSFGIRLKASENLAKILVKQEKYSSALKIYEALRLSNPEKSGYFAGLIEEVSKKIKK